MSFFYIFITIQFVTVCYHRKIFIKSDLKFSMHHKHFLLPQTQWEIVFVTYIIGNIVRIVYYGKLFSYCLSLEIVFKIFIMGNSVRNDFYGK